MFPVTLLFTHSPPSGHSLLILKYVSIEFWYALFFWNNQDSDIYGNILNIQESYMKIIKMEDILHKFDMQINKSFNTLIMKYVHNGGNIAPHFHSQTLSLLPL